jgi:hypothetical protein
MSAADSCTNVTSHPTAEWTARQILEAFPFETAPRYVLRDRDGIYGERFREQVAVMNIKEVLSAPRSPWQRTYVEGVIGTFVLDNKSSVLWRSPLCGAEARAAHQLEWSLDFSAT